MLQAEPTRYAAQELPTVYFGRTVPLTYVLNPKAACTLAMNFLFLANHGYRYFDPIQIHYARAALLRIDGPKTDTRIVDAFHRLAPESFSIVRDPLNRFISGFLSKVFSEDDPLYRPYRDILTSLYDIDLRPEADPNRSCLAFARWLASQSDLGAIDRHFRPQWINLRMQGAYKVDTILRLEDRFALLAYFSKWIGADKAQWFLSLRFNEHRTHAKEDVLSDELTALVREIYAEDYRLFYSESALRKTA
jgi:hypothetical protein